MVLGLRARVGDDGLPLGGPGDQVVPEEHGIAQCRTLSVRAASPVSVGVGDQVRPRRAAQHQTQVWCPAKVAQDALHGHQVWLLRVVHVQTNLLHGVGDVGPCERQVLESSCNAPELRGVLNGRPRVPCQLCLEVDSSCARLAVFHDRMFEDAEHIGALMK
jgi:hypothetical protein